MIFRIGFQTGSNFGSDVRKNFGSDRLGKGSTNS